ncbi:porin (plasmid) [Rhizobium sp. CCGE531]|nr:porin [Rhizobium sp. CCGE531]TGE92773.1 porin [Rhizobium sp. SEMIA 4088]
MVEHAFSAGDEFLFDPNIGASVNIRPILLGGIATLSVAPSVCAIDQVVAVEPEPAELVRICDAYGKGYFYIPGSETCMQVGGMVRTQASSYNPYAPVEPSGTTWLTRSEIYVNAATETEYGLLKTTTTLRFDYTDDSSTIGADLPVANISLGGFLIGRAGSQYNDWIGYVGNVINPDVIGNGPLKLNQLSYFYDCGVSAVSAPLNWLYFEACRVCEKVSRTIWRFAWQMMDLLGVTKLSSRAAETGVGRTM